LKENKEMKKDMVLASAALALVIGTMGTAYAGTDSSAAGSKKGRNSAAEPSLPAAKSTGVSTFNAAMEIAEAGRLQKDPLMLVAAARVVLSVGATPGKDESKSGVTNKSKPTAAAATDKKADVAPTPVADRLLAEATDLARDNQVALLLIRETQVAAGRGTTGGPHSHETRLLGRSYVEHSERFVRGQLAEAVLAGDGDTDVDIAIFDERGNRICSSTRSGDREYCSWTPAWTGNFTVRVTNYGSVYNDVAVLIN
jgi:hypothetical protein